MLRRGRDDMSDVLRVEVGRRPWLPVANVTPGEVFDYFNVPRAGLLHANGRTYFFDCILGDGGHAGVWVYSLVTVQEIANLVVSKGPDEFDAVAEQLITNRRLTLAAAGHDTIIYSTILDAEDEGAAKLTHRLMERWELAMQAHEGSSR